MLDEWCGVNRVINARKSRHLVVPTLFWKNETEWHQPAWQGAELPAITRELMRDARKLGLVTRFAPWDHYVQPLLEGAAALRLGRPDIVFRVYLAADLEFLIPDLVEVGCEVFRMRGSSILHNPGAMWRFLAMEEEGRWVEIAKAGDLAENPSRKSFRG